MILRSLRLLNKRISYIFFSGDVSVHTYLGGLLDPEEKDKLARNLGPNNKVLLLSNQGALCCGETIEEAFFNTRNIVLASESQLKLLPVGMDNLGENYKC